MADCLLGLGSNLGDRANHLVHAVDQLSREARIELVAMSDYVSTEPVGGPAQQGSYLNAAVRLRTSLSPGQLLDAARRVEHSLGRQRLERWGPRVIDIDVLLYDREIIETDALIVPHPRMAVRRFVLEPACQVAAEMLHPTTGWTLAALRAHLDVPPFYVALAGIDRPLREGFAHRAAEVTGARLLPDPVAESPIEGSQFASRTPGEPPWLVRQELAALARRAVPLASLAKRADPAAKQWVISTYWINQSLAMVRAADDAVGRGGWEQTCREIILRAPLPKLTLLLDPPTDLRAADPPRGSTAREHDVDRAFRRRVARELRLLALAPGQGPVIRVAGDDEQTALTELAGAMDAMC
jgi:2-amino-4-hydroxy-6-hydroxymethyldihydropteridine diphosphokinase